MFFACLFLFSSLLLYRLSFEKTEWCSCFIAGSAAAALVSAVGAENSTAFAVFLGISALRIAASFVGERIAEGETASKKRGIVLCGVGDGLCLVLANAKIITAAVKPDSDIPSNGSVADIDRGAEGT